MEAIAGILAALESAPGVLVGMMREIPEELRKRRPAAGKWSAHEHMCHLAVVNPIFLKRLELIVREAAPRIAPYNPSAGEAEGYLAMDLEEAMEKFARERGEIVAKLRGLGEVDWTKPVEHPEYAKYSALIMCRHLMLHDGLHGYRIEEILLKRDW